MKALQTPGECCPGCEHSLACLSRGEKYCHNGGMASPTITASACLGVQERDHGPSGGPLKTASLQGKSRTVWGSVPFGGRDGLECLFFTTGASTATTGARPPPQLARAEAQAAALRRRQLRCGVHDRHPWPPTAPSEVVDLQGNRLERRGPTRLGAQNGNVTSRTFHGREEDLCAELAGP